jgi:PP-loop superfamily ATP-utilizing enzyme
MKALQKKFISILRAELEDLIEDIELLMSVEKERFAKNEITNYVYMENTALFKNEIACLNDFIRLAAGIRLEDFDSLEKLGSYIEEEFKNRRQEHEYQQAVMSFVSRKIAKVINYVRCE